jgi:hypothetical protein
VATYYFRSSNGVWNSAQSWSLSDGGIANGAIPTFNDDAYFTSNSGNCTVPGGNVRNLFFSSSGFTEYNKQFTASGDLNIAGDLILSPSMGSNGITGSGTIFLYTSNSLATSANITSNGKSISKLNMLLFNFSGPSKTYNLTDTCSITDSFQTQYGGVTPILNTYINGSNLYVKGNFTSQNNVSGSSTIYISPLANKTSSINAASPPQGVLQNNFIISGSGHINFIGAFHYKGGKLTYVTASSITFTGNHYLQAIGCTLDTGNMTWNRYLDNGLYGSPHTIILSSSLNISSSIATSGVVRTITGSSINNRVNVYGNISIADSSIKIPLTITGSASGRTITNLLNLNSSDIEIKTTGGSITFPSTVTNGTSLPATKIYNNSTGGTLTTTSTTLVAYAGSSLILDTNTISWGRLIAQGNNTITLSSSLTASNILLGLESNAQQITFTGSAGWICSNLTSSSPIGRTVKLAGGVEYKTTNNAYLTGSVSNPLFMSSSIPSTRTSWSLDPAASQYVKNVNGYKINSSNGQTIWTTGTTSDTVNWSIGSQPSLSSYTFFID